MRKSVPFIVHANHASFSGESGVIQAGIESRLCLWSHSGKGQVRVNREHIQLEPLDYLFLPWGARMHYCPDRREPFHLSGIHIIPSFDLGNEVNYGVAHSPDSPLHGSPQRRDTPLPDLDGLCRFRLQPSSPLLLLSEYIVSHFQSDARSSEQLARLAQSLLSELRSAGKAEAALRGKSPRNLRELLRYIDDNLSERLTTTALATRLSCSTSQVRRLFRQWLKCSPMEWVSNRRVERGRELLSSTREPVGRVAARLGFSDQFYFSRVFKKRTGFSPLTYRRRDSLV